MDSYQSIRQTEKFNGIKPVNAWIYIILQMAQRMINSHLFDGGAFAPAMDQPAHCFSRIVAQAVLDAGGTHGTK